MQSYSVVGMLSQVTKVSRSERISQTAEEAKGKAQPSPCWHSSLATYTRSRKLQEERRQGTHEGRAHPATLACMPAQVRKLAETCKEEPRWLAKARQQEM